MYFYIMAFIYTLADSRDNIIYVGQTKLPILRVRFEGHQNGIKTKNTPLYIKCRELIKQGDNIICEPLEECQDNELKEREQYWIHQLHTWGYSLYNTRGTIAVNRHIPQKRRNT